MKGAVAPADATAAEGARALLAGLAAVFLRLARLGVDGGYKRRVAEWVTEPVGLVLPTPSPMLPALT